MMNLRDLVEKTLDASPLRETIGLAADELMELTVGAATGAAYLPSGEAIVRLVSNSRMHPTLPPGRR